MGFSTKWQRRFAPQGLRVRRPKRLSAKQLDRETKTTLQQSEPIAATRTTAERTADEARVKAIRWRQEQAELRLQRTIKQRRKAHRRHQNV
jgi:hypothetical protein